MKRKRIIEKNREIRGNIYSDYRIFKGLGIKKQWRKSQSELEREKKKENERRRERESKRWGVIKKDWEIKRERQRETERKRERFKHIH